MRNFQKKGILLVAFGTSHDVGLASLDNIEAEVGKAFPDSEVRRAFTSRIIRQKLMEDGRFVNSPAEALTAMGDEGFTHVVVQSLHIIPGGEYENLKKTVDAFRRAPGSVKSVKLGKPLLYYHEDIAEVCSRLKVVLPSDIAKEDAVIFMGHGTEHQANIYYPGIQYYLWQQSPRYWIATVEGYPLLGDILPNLAKQAVNRVWLIPFLSVAGNHAVIDMAGEGSDSWKTILESEGYEVKISLKGLAEYNEIVRIWINRIKFK